MNPKDDPTSIGHILMLMGVVSKEELEEAIMCQQSESPDVLIGRLLVAASVCSPEQLNIAVAAQKGLRKKSDAAKACAMTDVALFVKRANKNTQQRLIHKVREATGEGHPAITAAMLPHPEDE